MSPAKPLEKVPTIRLPLRSLILIVSVIACSDEDRKDIESFVQFKMQDRTFRLSSSRPETHPIEPGNFQFSWGPVNMDKDVAALSLYNPYHVEDAPCFSIMRINPGGFVCGLIGMPELSALCNNVDQISRSVDGCEYGGSVFDPLTYDQSKIYLVASLNIDAVAFGGITSSGYDPVTGQNYSDTFCNYEGTFSIIGVNIAGDTLKITEGQFRDINIYD